MVVEKIKALWSEMPWQGKLIMVCIGLCMVSSALLERGFSWHIISWQLNRAEGEDPGGEFWVYLQTPWALVWGSVLLLSALTFVLTLWSAMREDPVES